MSALSEKIKSHPIVAGLLLIGSIIGAVFGIAKAILVVWVWLCPERVPVFEKTICDGYAPECHNAEFLQFLDSSETSSVDLNLQLIYGAPSSYWDKCSNVSEWIEEFIGPTDSKTLVFSLATEETNCEPEYFSVPKSSLIEIPADQSTAFSFYGKFAKSHTDGGIAGWNVLTKIGSLSEGK